MEKTIFCAWCGQENPATQTLCSKCHRHLDAKDNLLLDYLLERTKDKFKGEVDDGLYSAIKNFLLSHLYSVIITISLVITTVSAIVISDPAAHIEPVDAFPITNRPSAGVTDTVNPADPGNDAATAEDTTTAENTAESGDYILTAADKAEISQCLSFFAGQMCITGKVGGDSEYLDSLISDELETALGYDSYLDMYPDHVEGDLYPNYRINTNEIIIDESSWSTKPLTENGQQLVDMGYTIATVYVDYRFYGQADGIVSEEYMIVGIESGEVLYQGNSLPPDIFIEGAPVETVPIYEGTLPDELLGDPRYLMTFAKENGKWLLVEQINVKDRYDERVDAFL